MANAKTSLTITVDAFSGRENPVIELKGKKLQEMTERLVPKERMSKREIGLPPIPTLGYRGLIIEQKGDILRNYPRSFRIADGYAFGPEFAIKISDDTFEDFICGSVPKPYHVDPLREALKQYVMLAEYWRKFRWRDWVVIEDVPDDCACAPLYEPSWWNVSSRQPFNNCYNYGCNYRTNTFAQPGRAAGQMYNDLSCSEVKAAAIHDELIDSSDVNNTCPDEGHVVALVVAPNWDYHWYRKGRDGKWTHKPGGTAVTNLDNSGNIISDPRTADRGMYTDFCTFMIVMHGHIKIS